MITPLRFLTAAATAIAAATLVACGDAPRVPLGELSVATASQACGPADEASTTIQFASDSALNVEPRPQTVRVTLPDAIGRIANKSFAVSHEAVAVHVISQTDYEAAVSGVVTIGTVGDDKSVDGSVDLLFPDGRVFQRSFHARWVESLILCG